MNKSSSATVLLLASYPPPLSLYFTSVNGGSYHRPISVLIPWVVLKHPLALSHTERKANEEATFHGSWGKKEDGGS